MKKVLLFMILLLIPVSADAKSKVVTFYSPYPEDSSCYWGCDAPKKQVKKAEKNWQGKFKKIKMKADICTIKVSPSGTIVFSNNISVIKYKTMKSCSKYCSDLKEVKYKNVDLDIYRGKQICINAKKIKNGQKYAIYNGKDALIIKVIKKKNAFENVVLTDF